MPDHHNIISFTTFLQTIFMQHFFIKPIEQNYHLIHTIHINFLQMNSNDQNLVYYHYELLSLSFYTSANFNKNILY